MNLFIGVIMNSMEESQRELAKEINEVQHKGEGTDELYKHIITRLDELNNEIRRLKRTE